MSTGFRTNNVDLANIFKPGTSNTVVGYKPNQTNYPGKTDLSKIFAPYTGGLKASNVGYSAYVYVNVNSSLSALGTGLNSYCNAIAVDSTNNVYVGGSFTTAGGVSANYIAKSPATQILSDLSTIFAPL
jgi:hypothetical protein